MIRITSTKDGFRRCGVRHPAKPTTYDNDKFTPEQLKRLKAEPMLVVEELPDTEPDAKKTKEAKKPEDKGADKASDKTSGKDESKEAAKDSGNKGKG